MNNSDPINKNRHHQLCKSISVKIKNITCSMWLNRCNNCARTTMFEVGLSSRTSNSKRIEIVMCERCEISDAGENMKIVILSCALGAHFARLSCCSDQRRRPHNKVGLGKQTLRPSRDHWKSICMGCFWIHVSTHNSCLATPINLKPRLTYFNTRSICKVTLAPCLAKLHGNKHIVFSAKSCSLPQWNQNLACHIKLYLQRNATAR